MMYNLFPIDAPSEQPPVQPCFESLGLVELLPLVELLGLGCHNTCTASIDRHAPADQDKEPSCAAMPLSMPEHLWRTKPTQTSATRTAT
jgi:hypothetical protein